MNERMIIIEVIKVYEISYEKIKEIIDKWSMNEKVDHFLYFAKKDDFYICIDNEIGAFYIETFETRTKAICWLLRNDYTGNEIAALKEVEVRRLLKNQKYEIIDESAK